MTTGNADILLSVIVPVGPGDLAWRGLLESLDGLPAGSELIFSASESAPDGLPATLGAQAVPLAWLAGPAGRACQLNAGLAASRGDWLWLLHADCRPERAALSLALDTVATGAPGLYYFDLAFLDDGPRLAQLNSFGANLRSRLFSLPFGDQAFLFPRRLADELAGFDENVDPGEDLDFVVRARVAGWPPRRLFARVRASARAYRDRGWLATTLRHGWLSMKLSRQARARMRGRPS